MSMISREALLGAVEALDHYPGHVMRSPNSLRWVNRETVLRLIAAAAEYDEGMVERLSAALRELGVTEAQLSDISDGRTPAAWVGLRTDPGIQRHRLAVAIDRALRSGLIPGLGVTWADKIATEYDTLDQTDPIDEKMPPPKPFRLHGEAAHLLHDPFHRHGRDL